MKTFLDVVQETDFRKKAQKKLSLGTAHPFYSFKNTFPILYRYRALSEYTLNDIINQKITTSHVGNFNDIYDGAVQIYSTDKECYSAAKSDYKRHTHSFAIRNSLKAKKEFLAASSFHYKRRSLRYLHYLDTLDFSVACFSSKNNSTLMWAHYADSNKGLCIGYNFNDLNQNSILKKIIFPVAYSKHPIELSKLFDDKVKKKVPYPYDTAALCSALCKANCWKYENEWRLVFDSSYVGKNSEYISYPYAVNINIILFGFHFLKNFFYCKSDNIAKEESKKRLGRFLELLDYMIINDIEAGIMLPKANSFNMQTKKVDPRCLKNFIRMQFQNNEPEYSHYFYTIQEIFWIWLSKH